MNLATALKTFESGGRNIPNTDATTSSGQAQGYYQITTGTWRDFAPKAGVSLVDYPTPLDAPADVQAKVAGTIPLARWAPETLAKLRSMGFILVPNASLASNIAWNQGVIGDAGPDGSAGLTAGATAVANAAISDAGSLAGAELMSSTAGAGLDTLTGGITGGLTGGTQNVKLSLAGSLMKSIDDYISNWFGSVQNWFVRAALITLGIVLIAVALVHLMSPKTDLKTLIKSVPSAIAAA
jgi:hypothetical protein